MKSFKGLFAAIAVLMVAVFTFFAEGEVDLAHVVRAFEMPRRTPEQLAPGAISAANSRAYVFVDKTGFGHQHGVEGRVKEGSLQLGAQQNAGKIVFDTTSFRADTDAARKYVGLKGSTDADTRKEVNADMVGADVLYVRKYPTATFEIASALLLNKRARPAIPCIGWKESSRCTERHGI